MKNFLLFLFMFLLLTTYSCKQKNKKPGIAETFTGQAGADLESEIIFAEGFDLYRWNGITKLVVYHPELKELVIGEYYLANNEVTSIFADTSTMISLPMERVAVFSATQLNAFDKLGILDRIVGVSEAQYIVNSTVKQKIEQGEAVELAGSGSFFVEKTITVNPELIFHSPYKVTESHALDVTGIPLIPFFDYFENDPLARAEWIRFTAAFFGKDDLADSLFAEIVTQYKKYKVLAAEAKTKPTVFSDKYFNGQWYVPGGQSYISRLFQDAGADYLWSDDPHYSSFPLDYEVVFGKAHNADFWRIVGSYGDTPTYAGLEAENGLYKHFKAFQEKKVIYCNARETAYFETSPLEPQLILGDLIKAFHPELLPDYKPKYYKVLP